MVMSPIPGVCCWRSGWRAARGVVARGWRDLLKGRDVSTYGFVARLQLLGVKLLPHRFAMWVWCRQQKIKN